MRLEAILLFILGFVAQLEAQTTPAAAATLTGKAPPGGKTNDKISKTANAPQAAPYAPRTLVERPSNTRAYPGNARSAKQSEKKADAVARIQWLTIQEATEKAKIEKRKVYIDVYTNWCGWCKHMDSTTFRVPAVVQYLNEHYYAVKLNAEQTEEIVFRNKIYRFQKGSGRGVHELATELLGNRLSYPTSVFLDEGFNVIQPLGGYLDAVKMEVILHYFGTNRHKNTPWETFERNFVSGNKGR
jgi:thioredoxin-related protein